MRLTVRKAFGVVHLWLGLLSGLVIMIVALTGAAYVFYNELSEYAEHEIFFVKPQQQYRIPLSRIQQIGIRETKRIAGKKLPSKWDWTSINTYGQPDRSVVYSSREYKKFDVLYQVYINPYNGKIIASREGDSLFWEIVIGLHTQLLLGDIGAQIVNYATLIFLFMIISGMVLWWPKNRAAAKKRFTFKWSASPKRLNYDLHNILGFYMCWIVIFSVFTGLVWAFEWARATMYYLSDGKVPIGKMIRIDTEVRPVFGEIAIDQVEKGVKYKYPTYYMQDIAIPQTNKEVYNVRIWNRPGQSGFADNLNFHPVSGQLISVVRFEDRSTGDKLYDMSSDLHYGWIFGLPTKFLMFFGCLVAASLPVTGFKIWLGRNNRIRLR